MKVLPISSSFIDSSPLKERVSLPLAIPVQSYLRDHHYAGKIILPAVEILERLAGSIKTYCPDAFVGSMRSASFDRFLPIEGDGVIDACHELEVYGSGRMASALMTEVPAGTLTDTPSMFRVTSQSDVMAGVP